MFAKLAVIVAIAGGCSLTVPAVAADLRPDTLEAWNQYIHGVKERQKERVLSRQPFLWTDESPERLRRVRHGEVVVAPVVGPGIQEVPNGLIHDWIGAAFIPNASVESLVAVLNDHDRYKDIYSPVVTDSKVIACAGTDPEFSMTWHRRVLFVNAALEGRFRTHDSTLDARHGYTVADTTQIQEIQDYGRDTQHPLPPDTGSGFMWRMHSITRRERRDGGVYLEIEAIALTRDIPSSLRWLVSPVVDHLSINSLTATLRQTREAVIAMCTAPVKFATC